MASKKNNRENLTNLLEAAEEFAWKDWYASINTLASQRKHRFNVNEPEWEEAKQMLDMAITAEQSAYRRWLKACAAQDAWLDESTGHHAPSQQRRVRGPQDPISPNPS
jgi:hypothetical protein